MAGIVHWDQITSGSADYGMGRRLLMGELSAVCRAAAISGAQEILVNDAHATMRNIDPEEPLERSRILTGHLKPMYMMEGLDESFDAAIFLGYHGPIGSASVLSHSYSPAIIWEARINGRVTGETGLNAMVAHYYGVPVVMITGDDRTVDDAAGWIPEARGVAVKASITRFSASSLTAAEAVELIFDSTQKALEEIGQPPADAPATVELTFQSADMAVLAGWVPGVERTGERTIRFRGETGLEAYRLFVMVLFLARSAVDIR
ncbi:MAG TPA: M55 family metallopeptidase [Chloroflexota bacterium]|nr:M55 family metallopeptidase [Chloroflexota bacterium]